LSRIGATFWREVEAKISPDFGGKVKFLLKNQVTMGNEEVENNGKPFFFVSCLKIKFCRRRELLSTFFPRRNDVVTRVVATPINALSGGKKAAKLLLK
jgi:hypothetical protein